SSSSSSGNVVHEAPAQVVKGKSWAESGIAFSTTVMDGATGSAGAGGGAKGRAASGATSATTAMTARLVRPCRLRIGPLPVDGRGEASPAVAGASGRTGGGGRAGATCPPWATRYTGHRGEDAGV